LSNYKIAETDNYVKKVNSKRFKHLYAKISDGVYPILKNNPFFGGNIKKLKGEYTDVYRFRIGDYRLFYTIDDAEMFVVIINIEHRQSAYKV
jgi:mRNA interferase RelE/StbE